MKTIRYNEQLIDTFLTGEKEDSETAFETLVKRHGPMVLGVCRHVLGRIEDAEDAFQATFLVLARKADTIRNRATLGCWLHEVAHRTALRAREVGGRSTPRMEIQEVEEAHSGPEFAASRNELRLLLRAEVDGLPAKYRSGEGPVCLVTASVQFGRTSRHLSTCRRLRGTGIACVPAPKSRSAEQEANRDRM